MMDPYLIILADDHAMVRQGIKRIIEETNDLKIIGEASDGIELLELLKKVIPDMVILDISMPNLRGIEATREIKGIHPKVKILILSMHRNEGYLQHAISAGADGYLLKEDADNELFAAIETIRRGEQYISPLFTVRSAEFDQMGHVGLLSAREREILQFVAEGKTSKEIADRLCLSVRTVEGHRANIMKKLNLRKTADLLQYAIKRGYVLWDM